tara:strand:- start:7357 stop:8748 length:1392 start_codon:yes stop_codon:yes gene_type:complete
MTNLEKYSQDIIVLEDIEIEKIQCLNCGEFYEKEYIDDNGDIIENSCNSEKCSDISDMEDCYEYFLSNNDERKCTHCNCSSYQKTLFCIYRNRLNQCYMTDEDYFSNDRNIICRDCFFNVCSCCGYKGVNQFASSAPYDCACSECWLKCNFLHGECCNCGVFDYLDFVRTRDEYIVNSEFENHHNRDNLKLYCFYCLEGIYESNFELDEGQGYISEVKTSTKCNCCLRDIKSKDTECIYGSVSKERNRRIKNRNHEIENVFDSEFDNLLSRYLVSFEMGDIKTEKEKRLKIHKINYSVKSSFELPNKYTRAEFEFYIQEDGNILANRSMDLCSDCLLYGILKNLLKFGKFPRYEYEVERFMDVKSLDDMKDLFDREYNLVNQINLNKSFDTFIFDFYTIYNFMRINDYTNDILIGKLLFNNDSEYENYNTDVYVEKVGNCCESIKTEFSIDVNKIKLVSKFKN